MQKWEYALVAMQAGLKEINVQLSETSPEKWGTSHDTASILARLGEDGWELGGMIPGTGNHPENWMMVFKRPKK